MQQGAAMLDARGCIVYCNLSLAQLLGVARETVIGRLLLVFVASEDQPAPAAARYAAVSLSTSRRNPASGITKFRKATIQQKLWKSPHYVTFQPPQSNVQCKIARYHYYGCNLTVPWPLHHSLRSGNFRE